MAVVAVYSMLRTFNKMSKRLIFVSVFEAIRDTLGNDITVLGHLLEFEFGVQMYTEVVKLYKMYFFTLGNSLMGPGRSDVLKAVGVIFLEDFYPDFLRGNVCENLLMDIFNGLNGIKKVRDSMGGHHQIFQKSVDSYIYKGLLSTVYSYVKNVYCTYYIENKNNKFVYLG